MLLDHWKVAKRTPDLALYTAIAASILVFLIGALVLVGWHYNISSFKSVMPGYITMKANTAIGMICLALANLCFLNENSKKMLPKIVGSVAILISALIAVLTLAEYRFDLNFGIDELLFLDRLDSAGRFPPGRLAPITALIFLLVSMAQTLSFNRWKNFPRFAQTLSLVGLVISFQAFIGYLFGISYSFGLAFYTQMAVHTTLMATLVCVGLLAARSRVGWMEVITSKTAGGVLSRKMLLWGILVPPLSHWLQISGEQTGLFNSDFSVAINITANMLFFVVLVLHTAVVVHTMDQKKNEEEAKFRVVTEAIPQIIWTATADGSMDYYNDRWYEYTDFSHEESLGSGWKKALHPDDFQFCINAWSQSVRTGAPFEVEYRFRRASDGSYRWHLGRALALRDAAGQIVKWFGTCTDIEDKKISEQANLEFMAEQKAAASIRMSESRLRGIFDSAFDAIISMDSQGIIKDWNPQAERIFGWSRVEALNQRMSELIMPPQFQEIYEKGFAYFSKAQQGPLINRSIEVEAKRRNGELFPIQLSITPVALDTSFIFTAFIADITVRKQNERELISAKQEALNAAQAKSVFLANMSHEIRTPLNGIIGMTELVLESSLQDQQRKYVKIVQDSGTRLLTIINDILDFSKIEAGKMALEYIDFNVKALIEGQADLLSTRAEEKGLSVVTQIDPEIPSLLKGDPGRIGQVLLNLLSNAIKFSKNGSVVIRASSVKKNGGYISVCFSVSDSGIGLSASEQQRLFQPFTQADDSTARKYGGTGLGLSICKRLVELMSGDIGVESEPNKGSHFFFSLPLEVVAENEMPKANSHSAEPVRSEESPKFRSTIRVLVAEDNSVNQLLVLTMLSRLGYSAQAVANGNEAREAVAQGTYDLVLMDCQMPELDGFEATLAIRRDEQNSGRHIPIIALTANALTEDKERCLASGMDDYLAKPIKKSVLAEKLDHWVTTYLHKSA